MSFVEWIFLLGGLAVAGPVVAHLLAKPRFRRLPFTMLRFLLAGQVESQSRRKLRDVMILLLRCAIIVLIAMLFARPTLYTKRKPDKVRSVYFLGLDNSTSMAYSDGSVSYFDELVDSAVAYIRSADADGVFNICPLASGDWAQGLSKEQALAEIKGLEIVPGSANVGDFLSGLSQVSTGKPSGDSISVFVSSDFTPNMRGQFVDAERRAAVDDIGYKAITSSRPINNAAIIDAHVVSVVDRKLTLNATVANYGQVEQHRKLTAAAESTKSTPIDISLSANEQRVYQAHLDVGAAAREELSLPVELSLSASDGLEEDDRFCLGIWIRGHEETNILLVDRGEDEMFLLRTAMETLSQASPYDTLRLRQVSFGTLVRSDLDWADVVVCSTIANQLGQFASAVRDFVRSGGRLICFLAGTETTRAAMQLWQQGVLPALPGRCVRERTYIQPKPCDSRVSGMDNLAAKSLSNYSMDSIFLKGYMECKQHSGGTCLWQLQNDHGLVYLERLGGGVSILVNTSVDGSLGSLTKSSASVAFCRYLLGQNNEICEHSFACDERIMLPFPDDPARTAGQRQLWIETCDGRKRRAVVADSFLVVPDPAGIGWVKTLGKPAMCAGINLPQGETDMAKPSAEELDYVMKRVFTANAERGASAAGLFKDRTRRPLWRVFAWIIILLLLVEPIVANRLKR